MKDIDKIDAHILRSLELDGRLSNTELAKKVGLSPSACLRRTQDLERRGVIKGYRAVLDRKQLGAGVTVFVTVGLSEHSRHYSKGFEKAMLAAPEVRECHNVTGSVEYLLRVEVADLESYKNFHRDTLGTLSHVSSMTSYITLDSPKDMRA
ncbi:Lrp/AsnC family transcriptional regulator [Litorimonas haliclonae]|uniref:Lrp/AsnC family transcriptional regulator n=1 Tax=Litorimonas haliclonae TaxID=2081977 RepID=UPI0039F0B7A7